MIEPLERGDITMAMSVNAGFLWAVLSSYSNKNQRNHVQTV